MAGSPSGHVDACHVLRERVAPEVIWNKNQIVGRGIRVGETAEFVWSAWRRRYIPDSRYAEVKNRRQNRRLVNLQTSGRELDTKDVRKIENGIIVVLIRSISVVNVN